MFIINKKFKHKIEEIIKSNLIKKDDKILVAFSGGPDSVFLYYILNYIKKYIYFEISLLYVNHNLRFDVQKDIEFVKDFAKKNNVMLYIESVDVEKYSNNNKKSIELAARELRYKKLNEILEKIGYNKIATGHNLDDNIETVIFRLLRGTSIKGLKGIPRQRENIIRLILQFEKKEILEMLEENNKSYIIDYTNKDIKYTRNYIRNEIFPMFSKVNPEFRRKINELIFEMNENNKNNIVSKFDKNKIEDTKNFNIKNKNELIHLLEKNNIDLSRKKIEQIYNSFFCKDGDILKAGTKEINIGNNKIIKKEYNKIYIENIEKNDVKKEKIKNKIELKKNQSVEWYNYEVIYIDNTISKKDLDNINVENSNLILKVKSNFANLSKNSIEDKNNIKHTKNIITDNIVNNTIFFVRERENGDKININKVGNKKIKKILIDKKVPKWERDKLPIVEIQISLDRVYNENNNKIYSKLLEDKIINKILTVGDYVFSNDLERIDYNKFLELLNEKTIYSEILIIGRKKNNEQ